MSVSKTQLETLKVLIAQEPYVSMADDETRKASLEQKYTAHRDSPIAESERILQDADEWWNIEDAAKDTGHALYQVARRAYSMLIARREGFNAHSATAQLVLSSLVTGGLISSASKTAIENLGAYKTSVAQENGLGPKVRIGWFDRARAL